MANSRYSAVAPKPKGNETANAEQPRGGLLELSAAERQKFKKLCRDAIETWEEGSGDHLENIRRWNDLYEGVVEDDGWPWDGASTLHLEIPRLHVNAIHSVICRSMFTVTPLWICGTLDEQVREKLPEVEEAMDFKAKSELNTVDSCRQVILNASKDSLAWTKTYWCDDREMVTKVVVIESRDEFVASFPDAKSAGVTDEQYQEWEQKAQAATADAPLEINVKEERIKYRGPKTDVIEEPDFVRAPANAATLDDCWAYGHGFYRNKADLKDMARRGEVWSKAVDQLCKAKTDSGEDSWKASKDQIEGVTDSGALKSRPVRLHELIVRCDHDGDGEDEKYICTYAKDTNTILGVKPYDMSHEMYLPWRLLRRSGRMIGLSLVGMLEGMSEECDKSIRQEINSSAIDSVPVFIGQAGAKAEIEQQGAFEDFFKPGGGLFLEKPDSFKAFEVPKKNNSDSVQRRAELMRLMEMLIGPTQMLSGRESPIDPDAPGNKTIALIQQSNMRIEDYINELRISFDKLGESIASLYGQYGDPVIRYSATSSADGKRHVASLPKKILSGEIKFSTHGVTPLSNPEIELARAFMWWKVLSAEPMVGGDPERRRTLLSWVMQQGRLEIRQDLLPPRQEVLDEQMKALEEKAMSSVVKKLMAKGLLPNPPADAPGLGDPLALPGAPAGAPGLPPVNNLPPPPL